MDMDGSCSQIVLEWGCSNIPHANRSLFGGWEVLVGSKGVIYDVFICIHMYSWNIGTSYILFGSATNAHHSIEGWWRFFSCASCVGLHQDKRSAIGISTELHRVTTRNREDMSLQCSPRGILLSRYDPSTGTSAFIVWYEKGMSTYVTRA
jgi:hypothetical protein